MKRCFAFKSSDLSELAWKVERLQTKGYEIEKISHSSVLDKKGDVLYSCIVVTHTTYHA